MPMLAAVSRLCAGAGVPCQVAVEEQMACGTGICFSCRAGRRGVRGFGLAPRRSGLKPSLGASGTGETRMHHHRRVRLDGTGSPQTELGYPDPEVVG